MQSLEHKSRTGNNIGIKKGGKGAKAVNINIFQRGRTKIFRRGNKVGGPILISLSLTYN
jgi:hypothetical protein